MSVLAACALEAEAFALGRVLAGADSRVELARVVPFDDRFAPYVRIDRLGDTDAFERAVESDPQIAGIERLGGVDRVLYRLEWATEGPLESDFLAAIRAGGLLVERAVFSPGGRWLFRLRAPDYGAFSAFEAACLDAGITVDVRQVAHEPGPDGTAYGLTAKQREALVLAFDEGYFDVPSGTSLSELATFLDISRQAYTRRLDRALRNYLSSTGIEALGR